MKKTIKLRILDTTVPVLTDDPIGRARFFEEVEPQLTPDDYDRGFEVEIPSFYFLIAPSWEQGFVKPIIERIGLEGLKEKIKFIHNGRDISEEFYNVALA